MEYWHIVLGQKGGDSLDSAGSGCFDVHVRRLCTRKVAVKCGGHGFYTSRCGGVNRLSFVSCVTSELVTSER